MKFTALFLTILCNLFFLNAQNVSKYFIDKQGKKVFSADNIKFGLFPHFKNNLCLIIDKQFKQETFGAIDEKGNVVVSPIYKDVYICGNPNGFIDVQSAEGKRGLLKKDQSIIYPLTADNIAYCDAVGGYFRIIQDNKQCLLDANGKMILSLIYDEIIPLKKNLFFVKEKNVGKLINEKLEVLKVFTENDSIHPLNYNLYCYKKDGLLSILDNNFNAINDKKYRFLSLFYEELAFVKDNENSKEYLIDLKGNEFLKNTYDDIEFFYNGYSIVKKNDQFGIIDNCAKEVVPIQYNQLFKVANGFFSYKSGNKYGIINHKGKVVLQPEYEQIDGLEENMVGLKIGDDKWKYYNLETQKILDDTFSRIGYFGNGIALVEKYTNESPTNGNQTTASNTVVNTQKTSKYNPCPDEFEKFTNVFNNFQVEVLGALKKMQGLKDFVNSSYNENTYVELLSELRKSSSCEDIQNLKTKYSHYFIADWNGRDMILAGNVSKSISSKWTQNDYVEFYNEVVAECTKGKFYQMTRELKVIGEGMR